MEGQVKVEKKITLHLNEEEAEWLKALVQNPMNEKESERDKCIRMSFWNVLNQDNPHLMVKPETM